MATKLSGDHYRIEYACGHIQSQCRCIAPNKQVRRLEEPCQLCAPQWRREHPGGEELKDREWWRQRALEHARVLQSASATAVEVSLTVGHDAAKTVSRVEREKAIERTREQTRGYEEVEREHRPEPRDSGD